MERRLLAVGSLLVLAACSGERVVSPDGSQLGGPLFSISSGNPNFGWRPPIANQSATGTLNPSFAPKVRICSPGGADCTGTYSEYPAPLSTDHYQYDWKTPKTPTGTYRVEVWNNGIRLGYADVNTSKTAIPLYVSVNAGATLPIKFVITTDCTVSDCIDPNTGGTVTEEIDGTITGVDIPPQGGGDPITVEIVKCDPDLSSNGLRVFGSCITINSSLGPEDELANPALVFICDALTDPDLPPVGQRENIAMHRRHEGVISVLDNVDSPLCNTVGGNATVGSVLRALAHGEFKKAGRQFLGLIGPTKLYALHLGAGGKTGGFSDFQFAETATALPIGWESGAWSYQIDGSVPSGWETGPLFGQFGQGGFGEDHNGCGLIINNTHTGWPAGNTNLYLRRDFFLSAASTVQIEVAIDNDLQIYVDGTDVGPGTISHDGCPTRGSTVRTVTLPAGVHKLAIVAIDRGGSSYFDAQLTILGGGD